jgi:hypothetical protein
MRPTTAISWRIGFAALAFLISPGLPFGILFAFTGDGKVIAIAIQFSYMPALLLGIPLFLLFLYRGWGRWWHFLLGGIGIGAVEALFVHFMIITLDLWAIPVWAVGGGVCAVLFWAIAVAIPNLLLNADARRSAQAHS